MIPPHNIEAEQAVLGGIFCDNECISLAQENVSAEDFYKLPHRKIFTAMAILAEQKEPIDFITICNLMRLNGTLEEAGGASYLSSLVDGMPSSANIASYAKIVRQKAILRGLIQASNDISIKSHEWADDPERLLDEAERIILSIGDKRGALSFSSLQALMKDGFTTIERLHENRGETIGLPSGYKDLDKLTCGFQKSDLIIIAGRPSMGKTAFALSVAIAAAKKGHSSALFSLEMSKEQLAQRMICMEAKIDSNRVRGGFLTDSEWPNIATTCSALSAMPISVDDTPALNILEMRSKARRLQKEQGLDLIIVDYLQLMRGITHSDSREREISEISRSLKALAKELNIPIIALSQLNRMVENRKPPKPILADLRESGAIEQDADLILFLYREEIYDRDSVNRGICEVIVGKHRNGPTGTAELAFQSQYTRFESLIRL